MKCSTQENQKTHSLAPPKTNILSLSPFSIKLQKPKKMKVEVEERSHGALPQSELYHHLCHL